MASHFAWFLYSVLVFLACQDGAHSQNSRRDIQILEKLSKKVEPWFTNGSKIRQFGVLYLPGKKQLKDVNCHRIYYNDAKGVNGDCSYAGVANKNETSRNKETLRHSEWQLIYTALTPMLQKWTEGDKINCPETLYLYTHLAPDFNLKRVQQGYTCTQAIVCKIPKILRDAPCASTKIIVGFSEVKDEYETEACEGYQMMKNNGITEYHLTSQLPGKIIDCRNVTVSKPSAFPACKDLEIYMASQSKDSTISLGQATSRRRPQATSRRRPQATSRRRPQATSRRRPQATSRRRPTDSLAKRTRNRT